MNFDDELFLLGERIREAEQLARRFEREGREIMMAGGPAAEVELRRQLAEIIRQKISSWRQDEARRR